MTTLVQYRQAKANNPDMLILRGDSDFLMAFDEDARLLADTCGLTVHSSNLGTITSGFPRFSAPRYLEMLDAAGISYLEER